MSQRVKVYFDGGYRPLPDGMETAVVVRGAAYVRARLGAGTSMDAEWLALLDAVRIAGPLGLANVVLLGDSAAVVGGVNGTTRCRGAAAAHLRAYRDAIGDGPAPRVRHVGRGQNLAGGALARLHGR